MRTHSKEVTFFRPFILDGMDALEPAGTYTVDTEEEQLDTLNTQAWHRIRTVIHLERPGRTEYLPVDPEQLDKALRRDAAQQDPALPPAEHGTTARRNRARALGLWPSRKPR